MTAEADCSTPPAALASSKAACYATVRFENLRLLPVALRLFQALRLLDESCRLLWPDAGAAALARRDAPDHADFILDFNQWSAGSDSDGLVLAVGPQPSDYEQFMAICQDHHGTVVMLNGRLEDAAVGIGSVARERRRGFISSWQQAYSSASGRWALMRRFPDHWTLYRLDPDGYRHLASMDNRPDPEQISALMAAEDADSLNSS